MQMMTVPFDDDISIITSPYGMRLHPVLKKNLMHNGVDIKIPNRKVYSAHPGYVVRASYDELAGNMVTIKLGKVETVYMHLDDILVVKGQQIYSHQLIGLQGSTGRVTGPHLHFAVKFDGKYVDPTEYIGIKNEDGPFQYSHWAEKTTQELIFKGCSINERKSYDEMMPIGELFTILNRIYPEK